jgi:hypothetical protein
MTDAPVKKDLDFGVPGVPLESATTSAPCM